MAEQQIQQKLDELINDLSSLLRERIGDSCEGLTLVGSCAVGKMSLARPDIGPFLFLKKGVSADVFLSIGEIFTELIERYKGTFAIRPEFRPFKFSYPLNKRDLEVFIGANIVRMEEKDLEFPFGISKNVLAGMKRAKKVLWGRDILEEMDTSVDKAYLVKAAFRDVGIIRLQLSLAPSIYNLNTDYDMLFSEALNWGKLATRWGLEVAVTEEEARSGAYLDKFTNFRDMIASYKKYYSPEIAKSTEIILDARDHYDEWKQDKEKAYLLFTEAYKLMEAIWAKLLSVSS